MLFSLVFKYVFESGYFISGSFTTKALSRLISVLKVFFFSSAFFSHPAHEKQLEMFHNIFH